MMVMMTVMVMVMVMMMMMMMSSMEVVAYSNAMSTNDDVFHFRAKLIN